MTHPSPIVAESLVTHSKRIARQRFWILAALIGFYWFLVLAAPILTDEAGLLLLRSGWWRDADQYWLYGCVILVAGWTALGSGRLALRMLQGLIAIGWLLLAWLLGLTISPNWKFEVRLTTIICIEVAVATFAILSIIRSFTGKVLVPAEGTSSPRNKKLQYSLAGLLLATLLVGLTITLIGWINRRYRQDGSLMPLWHYASWKAELTDNWALAIDPLLIAVVCLPAFLSNRPRAFAWILGLFVGALAVLLVKNEALRDYISYSVDERNFLYKHYVHFYLIPGVANLASVAVCLISAAAAMRWLGYRIATQKNQDGFSHGSPP